VVRFIGGDQGILRPALTRMDVATFLPLLRFAVSDRRLGRRIVTVPAFPGCLFACWAADFVWQRILSQPGVLPGAAGIIRPVGDPYGEPQPVPDDYMLELFTRADPAGVIRDDVPPERRRHRTAWRPLAELAGPQRLDLLHRAMSGPTIKEHDHVRRSQPAAAAAGARAGPGA